jgi:hypothetical protein
VLVVVTGVLVVVTGVLVVVTGVLVVVAGTEVVVGTAVGWAQSHTALGSPLAQLQLSVHWQPEPQSQPAPHPGLAARATPVDPIRSRLAMARTNNNVTLIFNTLKY